MIRLLLARVLCTLAPSMPRSMRDHAAIAVPSSPVPGVRGEAHPGTGAGPGNDRAGNHHAPIDRSADGAGWETMPALAAELSDRSLADALDSWGGTW